MRSFANSSTTSSSCHQKPTHETIELIPGRLYWRGEPKSPSLQTTHWNEYSYHNPDGNYNFRLLNVANEQGYRFETDLDICYQAFAKDFGPLNIAVIWRYCRLMEQVMAMEPCNNKRVTHQTNTSEILRKTNSVFLVCAYCVVMEGMPAAEVYAPFRHLESGFAPFRDASSCVSLFDLSILTCLEALEAACKLGWFRYKEFDADFYEHYEKVENGDLNWIIDKKILAFATPQQRNKDMDGYQCWTPEMYVPLFKKWNVNLVIRLNKANCYDRQRFLKEGIRHADLYFNDGGLPPVEHVNQFLHLVENEVGGVAIHCKAGLGRTGTLIGAWVMKHYKMQARHFIAWNRLARPGSILGPQQKYLCDIQEQMFSLDSKVSYQLAYSATNNGLSMKVVANPLLNSSIENMNGQTNNIMNGHHTNTNNGNHAVPMDVVASTSSPRSTSTTASRYGASPAGNSGTKQAYSPMGKSPNGNAGTPNNSLQTAHNRVEQPGQGDWLLNQKRRAQGHKTTYSGTPSGFGTYGTQ